jgi:hypothetical protein
MIPPYITDAMFDEDDNTILDEADDDDGYNETDLDIDLYNYYE